MTVQADAAAIVRGALEIPAAEGAVYAIRALAALDGLVAALKAETERADKHCTHVLELLTERDVAKEQHANTLNRMLGERVERDMLAARCRDLEAALRNISNTDDALHARALANLALAAVAAPPTLTEPGTDSESVTPRETDGRKPDTLQEAGSAIDRPGSLSAVRDVPETAE